MHTSVTADTPALTSLGPGLAALGPAESELLTTVDAVVTRLAARTDAVSLIGPPLLPADMLARLDYFANFPHLGVVAARFTEPAMELLADERDLAELTAEHHAPTGFLLPSATCYGLLFQLREQELGGPALLTSVGRCFRNEREYSGLRRLWGFHMREILYVGDREGAQSHLDGWRARIEETAGLMGLTLTVEPANDPFYRKESSRARLSALDPVKHEFLAPDGTAIASVNRHRNFFGERLGISLSGQAAYSSCVAFGLERWVHALVLAHGSAAAALRWARDALG